MEAVVRPSGCTKAWEGKEAAVNNIGSPMAGLKRN